MTDAEIAPGRRVVLATFRGTHAAPQAVRRDEDYWRLVGSRGGIVDVDDTHAGGRHPRGRRVLVRFDDEVAALGLACHDAVPNALWIFIADLDSA